MVVKVIGGKMYEQQVWSSMLEKYLIVLMSRQGQKTYSMYTLRTLRNVEGS